ncbi:hypothetical protein C1645_409565 [Glomus cerebriforme]|uniref:Uncharacterized protein n=1 Tax=Glomus cerebriforme TaxID=658196 RepID=A0A397TH52_9GLOM|nr:hypothetical protein C1645_409565 [Glomus cerebriforme]
MKNVRTEKMLLEEEKNKLENQIDLEQTQYFLDATRERSLLQRTITNRFEKFASDDSLQPVVSTGRKRKNLTLSKKNKESIDSSVSKKAKSFSGDVEDDDSFISNKRVEGSIVHYNTSSSSSSQSLETPIGTESASSYDRPHTPPHQIRSTSENQDLLKRVRQEKQRTKSTYEPICSNIIDTTNKLLMDRLKIKRDYTWDPVTNDATKYIDELINSVCFKDCLYNHY